MKPDFAQNIAAAAAAGLLGACASGAANQAPDPATAVDRTASPPADVGELDEGEAADESADELQLADCCKGLNECKGKGGCAIAGKHDCQGLNECKGQGGCNAHCPGE